MTAVNYFKGTVLKIIYSRKSFFVRRLILLVTSVYEKKGSDGWTLRRSFHIPSQEVLAKIGMDLLVIFEKIRKIGGKNLPIITVTMLSHTFYLMIAYYVNPIKCKHAIK